MDENQRDETLQQKPCPICDGANFHWGSVGTGGIGPIFNEDETHRASSLGLDG